MAKRVRTKKRLNPYPTSSKSGSVNNGAGVQLTEPVLIACEGWLDGLPQPNGVNVALAMSYDLVQLLNRAVVQGYGRSEREDKV